MLVSAPGLWNFCFTLHLLCLYLHYELLEILPLAMTRKLRLLAFVAVCTADVRIRVLPLILCFSHENHASNTTGSGGPHFRPSHMASYVDLGHVPASLLLLRLPLDRRARHVALVVSAKYYIGINAW